MTAQSGSLFGANAGRVIAQLLHPRAGADARAGARARWGTGRVVAAAIAAGLVLGAVLALVSPLAAAVAALAVAAVGIGLSEAELRGTAHLVLYGAVGLLVPAIAGVIVRMVGLL